MSHHVDRRFSYIRGIWKRAQRAGTAQYREKEWQFACQALARLGTEESALPSRHAVRLQVDHMGSQAEEWMAAIDAEHVSNTPPDRATFCSAAAAMLVALLEHTERAEVAGGSVLCPKGRLLEAASAIC